MTIPALPDAPALGDSPEVFNTKAFAFVAALDDWGTAANAVGVAADADASAAAASASTATTQAGIATTKASEAAASALDANSAELGAQAAQTAAELAATNAAASYDSFDDRYLGAKSSEPSVDNDGGALIIGALYFNTTDQKMRVYASTGWKDAGSAVNGTARRQTFTATAGQTSFTVTDGYDANFADVYLNGVKLVNGTDVTVSSGTAVVLVSGAAAGDVLDVVAYGAFEVANTYTQGEADALFLTKVNPSYSGTLTGGTGVVNLGSGQFYKDASGNVGIGTSSPTCKLDISSSGNIARFSGSGNSFNGVLIKQSDASASNARTGFIDFMNENDYPCASVMSGLGTDGSSNLSFYTTPSGSRSSDRRVERAHIDSIGNFKFNSGYGSVATAYGCRAWVNFNGTGTVAIRGSGNVSSITDNGTGDYTVNFSTAMPDANYSWSYAGSSHLNDSTTNAVSVGRTTTGEQTASSLRFDTVRSQGSSMDNQDMALATVSIFR